MKNLSYIAIALTSSIAVSCNRVSPESPSANLKTDPMTSEPANIGTTMFKCTAELRQIWMVGDEKHTLLLKTKDLEIPLTEEDDFFAADSSFTSDKNSIADSPNINNLKLSASFAPKSENHCKYDLQELRLTSTTTFASLPRTAANTSSYCWDSRGRYIQLFQTISFGPQRNNVGARMQQMDDLNILTDDLEATAVEYSLLCSR